MSNKLKKKKECVIKYLWLSITKKMRAAVSQNSCVLNTQEKTNSRWAGCKVHFKWYMISLVTYNWF